MATDSVVQSAVTGAQPALDKITDRLLQIADKIGDNAGPAGKAAWAVTMFALRTQALVNVIGNVVIIVTALLVTKYLILPLFRKANASYAAQIGKPYSQRDESHFGLYAASIICFVPIGALILFSAIDLLSASTWVTVFSPEAGLALRILNGL